MRKAILTLNDIVENLLSRISRYGAGYLIASCVAINLIIVIVFSMFLFPGLSNPLGFLTLAELILAALILAPIIETYLIQGFIIQQVLRFSGNNKLTAILVSAMIFGMMHIYPEPPIALKAFLAGLLYAVLFFVIQKKNKNPLLFVMLAHAIYNLTVLILNYLT